MKNQWSIDPKRLLKAALVVVPATVVVVGLVCYLSHPVRVWLANGVWCIEGKLDGSYREIKYGRDCDAPLPSGQ
jgi:hypothetical protein